MDNDALKNVKIKLSLDNLGTKAPQLPAESNSPAEINNPVPDLAPKNIEPIMQVGERPKISIKKPLLQDVKPKVTMETDVQLKRPVAIPNYAKSNIPDKEESSATSTTLKISEDEKGKTQKIIEPQPEKKPIINLSSLSIKLDKEVPSQSEPTLETEPGLELESKDTPDIDFEAYDKTRKVNLSDTVKLKIKPQLTSGSKAFSDTIKETIQEPPPSLIPKPLGVKLQEPKVQETKVQSAPPIPKNIIPDTPYTPPNKVNAKKKPNWVLIGILGVLLLLIVYFMLTTISNLST